VNRRRSYSLLAALALLVGLLTPLAVGGTVAGADAATTWKCGKWHGTTSTSYRYCVKVTRIVPIVKQDGNYLLHNSHYRQTIRATCSWDHSTTWSQSLEGTVKAEAGLIFEKVEASVTAGVTHSTTDTTHLGFDFKIKPRHWAYCARGHVGFKVAGYVHKQICDSSRCEYVNKNSFSGHIPSSSFLDTGAGKNIDWSQYLPQK
jgi:hypothetical protein